AISYAGPAREVDDSFPIRVRFRKPDERLTGVSAAALSIQLILAEPPWSGVEKGLHDVILGEGKRTFLDAIYDWTSAVLPQYDRFPGGMLGVRPGRRLRASTQLRRSF